MNLPVQVESGGDEVSSKDKTGEDTAAEENEMPDVELQTSEIEAVIEG